MGVRARAMPTVTKLVSGADGVPPPLTRPFAAPRTMEAYQSTICREGVNLMAREFSVIIERDAEGYYVASVPALRGCHTQARSLDELMSRVREAAELCLEVQGESVGPLDFIGAQKITVA